MSLIKCLILVYQTDGHWFAGAASTVHTSFVPVANGMECVNRDVNHKHAADPHFIIKSACPYFCVDIFSLVIFYYFVNYFSISAPDWMKWTSVNVDILSKVVLHFAGRNMAGCLLCLTPPHTNVKRAHQEATLWSRRLFLSICATTTSYSIQNLKKAKRSTFNVIFITRID